MKLKNFPFFTFSLLFINYYITYVIKNPIFFFFYHVDFAHFLSNMFILIIFGSIIEIKYGKKNFLLVFLFSLLVSSLLGLLDSNYIPPFFGFSGVVFGIMGYAIEKTIYVLSENGFETIAFLLFCLFLIFYIYSSFLKFFYPEYHVAFYCHFGGLLSGVMLASLF